jgi:Rrf2 family protein
VKLSRKLEYACRVLAQLARFHGQEKMAHIDLLAESEAIPANYLVQILNELRNAGLILSKRGTQGGYALAMAPDRIGLIDILKAIEPDWLDANFEASGHSGEQVVSVWKAIGSTLEAKVSEYSLSDLVVNEAAEDMYYI